MEATGNAGSWHTRAHRILPWPHRIADMPKGRRIYTAPMTVRVFHVDDHEVIRIGIDAVIEKCAGLQLVGWAATADEALHRIPVARPDVAILDIQLGEGPDGIELCREIRSRWPEIHCLMFTAYGDDQSVFASIMAGASGYLLKGVGAAPLVEAVRAVAAGRSLLDPGVT